MSSEIFCKLTDREGRKMVLELSICSVIFGRSFFLALLRRLYQLLALHGFGIWQCRRLSCSFKSERRDFGSCANQAMLTNGKEQLRWLLLSLKAQTSILEVIPFEKRGGGGAAIIELPWIWTQWWNIHSKPSRRKIVVCHC